MPVSVLCTIMAHFPMFASKDRATTYRSDHPSTGPALVDSGIFPLHTLSLLMRQLNVGLTAWPDSGWLAFAAGSPAETVEPPLKLGQIHR